MSETQSKSRLRSLLGWIVRIGITVAIIGYLLSQSDLEQLKRYLQEASLSHVLAGIALIGCNIVITGLRWGMLMRILKLQYHYARAIAITFIGYFFNAFLPGSTGGDLVKAYYLIRDDKSKLTQTISSIAADRIIGLLTILLMGGSALSLGSSSLSTLSESQQIITALQIMGAFVITSLCVLLFFPFGKLPRIFHRIWQTIPLHEWGTKLFQTMRDYRRHWPATLRAVGVSVIAQSVLFFAVYQFSHSLDLEIKLSQMFLIMPVIILAMGLPISFSGHGVREYMFVLLYTHIGVVPDNEAGSAAALAVSFLFMASIFFWNLFGGLVFLFNKRTQPPTSHA